jgi:hypothetical protein
MNKRAWQILAISVLGVFLARGQALAQGFFTTAFWQSGVQLKIVTGAQSPAVGNCSTNLQIQSQNQAGTALIPATSIVINLASTGSLTFYSDPGCTQAITSVTMSAVNTVTVFFMDTAVENPVITVSASAYASGSQTETVGTNNFVWTGGGANALWSNGANWSGSVAPTGASNIAVFNGTCSSNCSPTLNQALSIGGIRMLSGYNGTVAMGAYNLNLGTGGLTVESGTFTGATSSSYVLTVTDGYVTVTGGTFTAPVGVTTIVGGWLVSGSPTVTIPTGSTLDLACTSSTQYNCFQTTTAFYPGSATYQNVTMNGDRTLWNLGGGTLNIAGNFIFGDIGNIPTDDVINNGTINVTGNITQNNSGDYGTATLNATGQTSGQTITGVSGGFFPPLVINTGSNPVTISGTIILFSYDYISSGSFTSAGSTLEFYCPNSNYSCNQSTETETLGSVSYNNIIFLGYRTNWDLNGSSASLTGSLSFGDASLATYSINNGTLLVGGNITQTNLGNIGSAVIEATGNASGQTITGTGGGYYFPSLIIAAGTNPVTFSGTIQTPNYTYTSSGTFTAAGSTLDLACQSATLACSNTTTTISMGSVTYGNLTINGFRSNWTFGGSTVIVAGNVNVGDAYSTGWVINNGTFDVGGNITVFGFGYQGTAVFVATGNASGQTITGNSDYIPGLQIAAGSNPVTLSGVIVTPNYTYTSSGTFTAGSSTLEIFCPNTASAACYNASESIAPGSVTNSNVAIEGANTTWNLGGATFNVSGAFTFGDLANGMPINNGTINVAGNITQVNKGNYGTSTIVVVGNVSGQTIAGTAGYYFPALNINAPGAAVTFSGTIQPSGYTMTAVGTLTTTGSTLALLCSSALSYCFQASPTITPGNVTYNNVKIEGYWTNWSLGGGTFNVGGLLTLGDGFGSTYTINNGTLSLAGGLTMNVVGNKGTVLMQFVGSAAQTVTSINDQMPLGNVTFSMTGGATVTLASTTNNWNGAGQNVTIASGTVNMNGKNLTVGGTLTIASGATLTKNGGTLIYGTLVNNGTLNP